MNEHDSVSSFGSVPNSSHSSGSSSGSRKHDAHEYGGYGHSGHEELQLMLHSSTEKKGTAASLFPEHLWPEYGPDEIDDLVEIVLSECGLGGFAPRFMQRYDLYFPGLCN
ncbi:hypothetical protein KKE33_00080 [Patescibacteria group bacterium]|nr:hypothetical protein [Patescibacteria group bacterium]